MPEVNIEGLTNKMGNIRKTAHQYSKLFDGDFGQVREHVILETTWLGNFEPYSNWQLSSYLADMMSKKGQNEMVGEYNMQPFTVQVLGKDRTLCEKIMSLVRFSQQRDPYIDLANKIRHIYDIHLMLRNNELKAFIKSEAFEKMLIKVGEDDVIGYKNDHEWLVEHPVKALIFERPEETWRKIKTAYQTTFRELVIGELPKERDLIKTLKKVSERLKHIDWSIKM